LLQAGIGHDVSAGILDTPPPLVTRVYQELGNGVLKFHEALKFRHAPFPFTYTAVTDILMVIHWCCTPLMVAYWTKGLTSCAISTFVVTFAFWSLNGIAGTLENPFGHDLADMDSEALAKEFNTKLKVLLAAHEHPPPQKVKETSLNPCASIVFDSVLHAFQDHGMIVYDDDIEHPASTVDFLTKIRNARKRRPLTKILEGAPGAEHLRSRLSSKTRYYGCQSSLPINSQQELSQQATPQSSPQSPPSQPHTERLVLESPYSQDDALWLNTKLQPALGHRMGATSPDFGKNLEETNHGVQRPEDGMVRERGMASGHVNVDVEGF